MTSFVFEINDNSKNMEIDLIKILLQFGIVRSKIWALETIAHLVCYLVILILKDKYLLICCC